MADSNTGNPIKENNAESPANLIPGKNRGTRWGMVILVLAVLFAVGVLLGRSSLTTYCKSLARHRLDHFEYTEALAALEFTENWGIDDAEVHFLKARIFRKTGKFEKFEASLATARGKGLPETELENEKSLLLGQSGNIGKLLEKLEDLAGGVDQFDPPEVYEALVNGLLLNGRFGEAMEYLESWQKDFPEDPNQKFYKATLLKRYGPSRNIRDALDQAASLLEEVTSQYPRHFRARMTYGEALLDLNQVEKAAEQFERCNDNPDAGVDAKVMLAKSYSQLGRQDDAKALYRAALDLEPENLIARMELGKILFDDENFEEALEHLEKAYPQRSWDYDLGFALGRTLEVLGNSRKAKRIFARANEIQDKRDEIQTLMAEVDVVRDEGKRFELGKLLMDYGNPELGVIYLKSLLDVNPNHQGAKQVLNDYYLKKSRKNLDVLPLPQPIEK